MPDGPFEEVVMIDIRMVGNQYHTRASMYRRYTLNHEMEFMRQTPEYGPFVTFEQAIRSPMCGVTQRRVGRVFAEITYDLKELTHA